MLAVYFKSLPKKEGTIMSTMQTMKLTFQPGWRWSEHVKPTVGMDCCEVPHFNYGISGRLHVRMDDGTESEIGPGDAQLLPSGHDAWVVGDEHYVYLTRRTNDACYQ
jgi:quercetin dioxygenase-like cupin family protein